MKHHTLSPSDRASHALCNKLHKYYGIALVQVLRTDPDMAAAAVVAGVEVVRLRLPEGVAAGLLYVEVQRGAPDSQTYRATVDPQSNQQCRPYRCIKGTNVVRLLMQQAGPLRKCVPTLVSATAIHLDAQCCVAGAFMGEAHPVAVLAGAAARAEVAAAVEALPAGQRAGFLADVGVVAATASDSGGAPDPECLSIHAALATARRCFVNTTRCLQLKFPGILCTCIQA